jgi:hypothetical protein
MICSIFPWRDRMPVCVAIVHLSILSDLDELDISESTSVPQPTLPTHSSTPLSTPIATAASGISESQRADAKDRLRNIIGQSVVGGILFLIIMTSFVILFRKYRRRTMLTTQHSDPAIQSFTSKKTDTESQMGEKVVPILLLHPPTMVRVYSQHILDKFDSGTQTQFIATNSGSSTSDSWGSEGSSSSTRATQV